MSNQTSGRADRRKAAGTAVERHVCRKYNLEPDHSGRADAAYANGTPVEIKAALREKSDGRGGTKEGEFYVFEEPHQWVRRHDGYYVFAVYRFRGRGVQVLKTKRVHASNLPHFSFHQSGHPDRNHDREARFKVSQIF
ncbi:hypothetical protein [Halostella pelagica]|uniref:hypothetical protein n=1 Tax=Halostella pelagica TaxID=2583824 RepID=UPI00108045AF|nr:hypothetical protein [Halostella pelagica]